MDGTRTRYALLFLALFVPYAYFNHSDGWTQGARIAELHSIVLKQTIQLDAYHQLTGDKAYINGHYYSEKAPAMVLLALPSFAVTVWIQQLLGVDPDSPGPWRVSEWIATAGSIGLLTALGGVAFYHLLIARFNPRAAVLGTFGVFLGTLTWPYATSLFAHAGTIGLFSIALCAALTQPTQRRDYTAGLAAGFAVASEYPAVIPCAILGLYLGATDLRRMWRFGVATVPAALLILMNNYLTTGSPWSLTYGSNPNFPEMSVDNAMGFTLPTLPVMLGLVVGEYRGLFFWCPVLVLSVVGLVEMFRADRATAVLVVTITLSVLLQVAAFANAFGGNAVGPRYLSPALPFIGLATVYGIKRLPHVGLILTLASMALMGMVTAIAIDPPGDVLTPLQSFYLIRIEQNRFADNLGTLIGLPWSTSLLVPLLVPLIAGWRVLKNSE